MQQFKEQAMERSKKYQDWLLENLKDRDEALSYLNAALEESFKGDKESQQLFFIALGNVVEAQGGIEALAEKANIEKKSLYKALSETSSSKWHTVVTLFVALGFNLRLT